MKHYKYLIIGAGITGLYFALSCKDEYIIIEKENEPGGYCRTAIKDGFTWDFAGHFFHFKSEKYKNDFLNSYADSEIIDKEKNTKIIYQEKLIDYPFQLNIHQLEKEEFIDCLYDLYYKEEKSDVTDFLDMLNCKFGKSITDKFLKPYNEKLYAVDLNTLDKDAMGRFFPHADLGQIINNMKSNGNAKSYNDFFMYPRKGAGSYIDILEEKTDSSRIMLNTSVVGIDMKNRTCSLSNGEKVSYDFLINTAPFNRFLGLLGSPSYSSLADSLSYNKVLVFNLGFDKKSVYKDIHWLYIPDKSINYYRVGFYDNILDENRLSMYVEIGFNKRDRIDIENQLSLTLNNLKKQGVIDETYNLVSYMPIIMDPAYVHINTENNTEVENIKDELSEYGIYSIGRYGAWTYCSMEDCMEQADRLAERLKENG